MSRAIRLAVALAATAAVAPAIAGGAPGYHVTRTIKVPDGGWDYARVDGATRKLYIARGTDVTEVDLAHGDAVRAIGAIMRGHAVVPIDGQKLLLVTSGRDDSVRLLDTDSGAEVAKIAVGGNPDAALYDAASGLAATMNARAGTVSVIDVAHRQVARTITLAPGLEYAALVGKSTLYVNNEDKNEIETADLATGTVGATIALTGCTGPSGLAYDAKTSVVISACGNSKAALVDAKAGKLIRLLDIGQGPDAVILDAARRKAFIPCGRDGTLVVIDLDARGGAKVIDTVATAKGARTGALDPTDGTVYLPTADFGPAPAAGGRPQPVAGSFRVLAVSAP
ncbi:YncE family protein [Sphingomonas sp. GlSt437]|uniref:YncE family protein n=1 Tax=Sphingomonas sp. GlSt437 TaxID=3389970 RepID=UPI003A8BB22B